MKCASVRHVASVAVDDSMDCSVSSFSFVDDITADYYMTEVAYTYLRTILAILDYSLCKHFDVNDFKLFLTLVLISQITNYFV